MKSATLLLSLLTIVVLVACKSLGTPEDQDRASSLWTSMEGYQSWGAFPDYEGWQEGKNPHGKHIRTFINATAASNTADLPFGSIIVKENFSARDESKLGGLTVMQRVEGYDSASGDWFWARYEPDGGLTHSGMVTYCSNCHGNAGEDDFVFLNDE